MTTTTKIECNDTNKNLEGCKIKEELDDVLRKLHRFHVRDQLLPVWITFLIFPIISLVIGYYFQKKLEEDLNFEIGIILVYCLCCVFIPAIVGWSNLTKGTRHEGGHDKKEQFEKEKERLINLLNKDYPNIDKLTDFGKVCLPSRTHKNSNDRSDICDGKAFYWGRTVFLVSLIFGIFAVWLLKVKIKSRSTMVSSAKDRKDDEKKHVEYMKNHPPKDVDL